MRYQKDIVYFIGPDEAVHDALTTLLGTGGAPVVCYANAEACPDSSFVHRDMCGCFLAEPNLPRVGSLALLRRLWNVEITVPPLEPWREHTPVLVGDITSTGRTMIETIVHLTQAGYAAPVCIGIQAVFAADAFDGLKAAGAADIVTCNTIEHTSNAIDLTGASAMAYVTYLRRTRPVWLFRRYQHEH